MKFHNGDAFTAEDVKFSFERYKGSGASDLKKKIKAVEIVNPHQVRFQLHEPWPDFLTFYATPATGVGWIVPKNYTGKLGSDKLKDQPVGLGPYRFVSYQPGVELILEANPELLHQIQQKLYDEVRFIPIWDLGSLHASGPRVAVSGLGLIPMYVFSGPYEDVQLKS